MNMFLAMIIIFLGVGNIIADDTDVYRASVKNNAMLVIDVSGSMAWPVYDANIDYAAFFEWAIPSYGHDDKGLTDWFADKAAGTLWEKDKIYLVSAFTGYAEVTGEDGVTKYAATGDPVYTGSARRQRWVTCGITDTGWEVTNWENPAENNTIERVTVGDKVYVVYPTEANLNVINSTTYTASYANSTIAGQQLKNHQDILLTDEREDPRTGIAKDYGFLGYLHAPGIYFSGLFETGSFYTLTDNPNAAATYSGDKRIYAFVTGNYLSFIKLIEDLGGDAGCGNEGWRYICYQPGARVWTTVDIGTIRNSQYYSSSDYSSNRNENCGEIDLTQFSGRQSLKIYFRNLDIENRTVGSCDCWNSNSENDGVYFLDQDGTVLHQLTTGVNETPEGKIYGCDQTYVWTGEYDVTNVTKIYVKFYVAPNGGDNCSGSDRGFRIRKIMWTAQEAASEPAASGAFSCCNGWSKGKIPLGGSPGCHEDRGRRD
jgi:hypothetical protein